jgi:Zn-dependent protease
MTGSRSLPLLRIFGIRVGVNPSWFLVLFVVIFVLWDSLNETLDASETTVYLVAVVAAASFFASIVAHELGHALAARREGIAVEGIDLFLFGGVMKMSRDTDSPGAEFRVAVAGPLVTLVLMIVASVVAVLLAGGDSFWDAARLSASADASPVEVVVSLLVSMNLVLLLFNLVPAFPLDGGRIARAAAWKLTGDRHRATRFAARIGIAFGWTLILGGLALVVLVEGAALDGIWFAALGWLLAGAARSTLAQTRFTEQLAGITVADVMDSEPVTIPAGLSALRAYEDFFLRYQGWDWFAVVEDDGRYAGIAHRRAVEHAALEEGGAMPVRELAAPAAADGQVPADAPLEALLSSEPLRRLGALMAVDAEGRLRGVVTFEQVTRALRSRLAPSRT